MTKPNYLHLEIMAEVTLQIGDILKHIPKAESRWFLCNVALKIIESDIINSESDDIDEIIESWIFNNSIIINELKNLHKY